MKLIITIVALAALTACADDRPTIGVDQCLRVELFTNCLDRIPKGPQTVNHNDWDEVVFACSRIAYAQSLRGIFL